MTISDWLMIIAVLLGPIIAVQLQKFIERATEKRRSKIYLFKTLMATRGTTLSPLHVEALNRIDLEFSESGKKDKAVIEAWKLYLDNLNIFIDPADKDYQVKLDSWNDKNKDLLTDLLSMMAQALGYHYDKVLLKRGAYTPKGHADQNWDNFIIRTYFKDVLLGIKNIPIWIRGIDPPQTTQQAPVENLPPEKKIQP